MSPLASTEDVRTALAPLTLKQLETLAEQSGVPFTTIYKIKLGLTKNPGLETVGKFLPLVSAARAEPDPAEPAKVEG